METIMEVFEDWTEIDTPKRLRGAILHGARILEHNGDVRTANNWRGYVMNMPAHMSKESINTVLYMICEERGMI